uniref:G-protein coupled receptors family 1 profile domain-containing protein n=1 Tax=Romanomermis culicivorax TaxID=13658 RepID=A0A915IIT9_ROMCU
MHTDKTMSTSNLYRIIIHMGYSDVLQLVFNGVPAGVYSILRDDRPVYVNKVLGAVVDGAWFAYIFLSQLLAVNRFVHIFTPHKVAYIFSDRSTKVFVAFCWIVGLCFVVALCLPDVDFYYSVKISSYLYGSSPASLIVVSLNLYIDVAHSIGLIGWYFLIYVKVHLKDLLGRYLSLSMSQKRMKNRQER